MGQLKRIQLALMEKELSEMIPNKDDLNFVMDIIADDPVVKSHEQKIKQCKKEIRETWEAIKQDQEKLEDRPEYNQEYKLTGAPGEKCIANGNTWKESKVK